MPYARRSGKISRKRTSRKGTIRRYHRRSGVGYRKLSRRISAVSRRVAGEVCKFESQPTSYGNSTFTYTAQPSGTLSNISVGTSYPLQTISSGVPWIMPINWIYQPGTSSSSTVTTGIYVDGQQYLTSGPATASLKQPIWYNTMSGSEEVQDNSAQLQYRLAYIYINALFNASIASSVNNTDGALRIVIVKDRQPTGGAATWADANAVTNSRGVFNGNRIDAQLNPNTVGRFKIMYDKTLRFNTTNGYKPFKYYKRLSTVVRNNRNYINTAISSQSTAGTVTSSANRLQSASESPPVQKNAYYMMIFSDGLQFTYTQDAATPAASFHLFNRVAYYNN